jgi:ureidoacrylate peracid hydrolase
MTAPDDVSAPHVDGLATWIAPSRTALVVIDVQVDFAAPEGALGPHVDLSSVGPAVRNCQRLIDAAHAAGALVIFVKLETDPSTDSVTWRERTRRRGGNPETMHDVCRRGTPGAELWGVTPGPGDPIIAKTKYSGFYGTDLARILVAHGRDTLIACGLTTECCVDGTVRDAFHQDYHTLIAADACAAYGADLHTSALRSLELNCAILTTTREVEVAWEHADG